MARSPDRHPGRGHRRDGPGPNFALALLLVANACASTDRITTLATAGDPARGREVFVSREGGHCVLCHRAPGVTPAGNVGPPLGGIGSRLDAAQLRARVADITRVYPDSVMPTFHRTEGMKRVASPYAGKPVLDARQLEDVVAWLGTLR
jgi:L-cysteine S-thiosulfotransferase